MKNCELCKLQARTYCESDEASLCWDCDFKVHGANFLVARHSRTLLCQLCHSLTPWKASGEKLGHTVSVCESCINGQEEESRETNGDDNDDADNEEMDEDDDDDEEEEEEEEEKEEESDEKEVDSVDEAGANNGSNSVTLTDPEVLDCPICCIPLTSPVFQCENGHVACSSCCTTLVNKCPACCLKIGYRNRALEKVIETSNVKCKFDKYGCKETVNYSKKRDHEETCSHVPCFCPLADCNFIGSSNQLYRHFANKHKNSAVQFLYNNRFRITLNVDVKYHILQEEKDGILFILSNNKSTEHHGNAISIACIASTNIGSSKPYDISAVDMLGMYTLKFESLSTFKSCKLYDQKPSTGFLLVPSYFFNSDGQLKLDVCIFRSLRSLTARCIVDKLC